MVEFILTPNRLLRYLVLLLVAACPLVLCLPLNAGHGNGFLGVRGRVQDRRDYRELQQQLRQQQKLQQLQQQQLNAGCYYQPMNFNQQLRQQQRNY